MPDLKQDTRILTESYKLERKWEHMSHKKMDNYLSRINDVLLKRPELVKNIFSKKLIQEKTFLWDEELTRQIAYKELQREQQNAFDMGHGMREVTNEDIHNKMQTISKELQDSINPWFDYIFSEDAYQYSLSAKYWIKEGLFAFDGRSKKTIKPFPKLNQQALAKVIDIFEAKNSWKQWENNIALEEDEWNEILNKKVLKNKDFTTLYTAALKSLPESKENNLHITKWEWKKYPRDYEGGNWVAQQLVKDIEDYHTGWCTAWVTTAINQLKLWDFYVYYSYDQEWKALIPRIAIRMNQDEIAEIRWIGYWQEMDEYIIQENILEDFLEKEFNENVYKEYKQKIHDTKKLTKIFNESFDKVLKEWKDGKDEGDYDYIWKNPHITKGDIDFLLWDIKTFGYREDERIYQMFLWIIEHAHQFSYINKEIALKLIERLDWRLFIANFEKFTWIPPEDHKEIAFKLLWSWFKNYLEREFYRFHWIKESFGEFYQKYKSQNFYGLKNLLENFIKNTKTKILKNFQK